EDGIRDRNVTGVQTCALPISCVAGYQHSYSYEPFTVLTSINTKSSFHIDDRQYRMVGMTLSQTLPLADLSDCCSLGAGPLTSGRSEERRVGDKCYGF